MTAPHDDDDLPDSRQEHPLSPALSSLCDAAEALQTWSSDLASRLSREGADAKPSAEELLGAGRLLLAVVESAQALAAQVEDVEIPEELAAAIDRLGS
ncbi:hypothetical protein L6R46_22630 [Myxococcota bacterium]|nr:hypothetical protein [Myxococcota bacterium]